MVRIVSFYAGFHGVLHFKQKFQCTLIQTSFYWLRNYMKHPKYSVDCGGGCHYIQPPAMRGSELKVKIEKCGLIYA